MMAREIDPIYSDYEQSFKLFKSLLTTGYDLESYPPARAEKTSFGKEFPGGLIRKPQYTDCRFIGSFFNASNGALSKFHNCEFIDSTLDNCDFRYCDILKSSFSAQAEAMVISNCNFSYGNFIKTTFVKAQFSGCSFRQMQFENTKFDQCSMVYSSIEQSVIKDCSFVDIDMSKVGVRYCIFENVSFQSVTLHVLDLARNYGLIQLLQKSPQDVLVAYGNGKIMSLSTALAEIKKLLPYYLETNQFYEMLNIYAANQEVDKIIQLLPYAFECVIKNHDFADLQDLCTLIVKFNMFSGKQLREFYAMIKRLIVPDNFPHYLRKSYNSHIENIKHILVDNPNGYPEAQIVLKTDILTLDTPEMHGLLKAVEANIESIAPGTMSSIQLTKHSPYDVLIVLCGALPEILQVCQAFYYALGGMKAMSDIKNSLKERTENHTKNKHPTYPGKDVQTTKRVEISLGKMIMFKYETEYTQHVKSLEYTIQ